MNIQTAFRLDSEVLATLKQLSKDDGRSMTWHVNKALNSYLNPEKKTPAKKKESSRFVKPNREDVIQYCIERGGIIDGDRFYDYCVTNGWKLSNGNPMKCWKSAIRTWEGRKRDKQQQKRKSSLSERSAATTAGVLKNCENVGDLLGSDDPFIRPQVDFKGG